MHLHTETTLYDKSSLDTTTSPCMHTHMYIHTNRWGQEMDPYIATTQRSG